MGWVLGLVFYTFSVMQPMKFSHVQGSYEEAFSDKNLDSCLMTKK